MDEQTYIRSGVAAYRRGDLIQAIDYFGTAARQFQSFTALAWLATLLTAPEEQRYCLYRLLERELSYEQRGRIRQRLLDLGGEYMPAHCPAVLVSTSAPVYTSPPAPLLPVPESPYKNHPELGDLTVDTDW